MHHRVLGMCVYSRIVEGCVWEEVWEGGLVEVTEAQYID